MRSVSSVRQQVLGQCLESPHPLAPARTSLRARHARSRQGDDCRSGLSRKEPLRSRSRARARGWTDAGRIRARSCSISPKDRPSCPTTGSCGPNCELALLRAGRSHASAGVAALLRSDRQGCGNGTPHRRLREFGYLALGKLEDGSPGGDGSSATAIRSPISASSPTSRWRRKAATTWRAFPRLRRGSRESRPSRAVFPW